MSAITKQALLVDNNQSFPNNNAGDITPSDLRAFNVNVIDSTVNQTEYTTNSGSWNVSISNINAFTASQQPSFAALNSFTASQLGINTGVNSFTQSASGRLNNLEAYTASFTTSVGIYDESNFVQNVNQINFMGNGITASYISGKAVIDVNFTPLNNFTQSTSTQLNSLQANFNSFTQSTDNSIALIEQVTASYATTGSNTFAENQNFAKNITVTQSVYVGQNIYVNGGIEATYIKTIYETSSVIYSSGSNQFGDASNDTQILSGSTYVEGELYVNKLNVTSQFNTTNAFTASQLLINAGYNTFTASQQLLNPTLATTGSNTFVGDQTISASLFVSGNTNVGFLNIADAGGINLAGTGSIISSYGIVTNPSNGDLVFNTNPGNGRLMTFSSTDGRMTQFNGLYFNAGDSSSTNGGIAVSTYSGSLFLTPSGFSSTTASMLHISSSSNLNNVNLIFKNSNTAADTIVSGSNNIFVNPVAPTAGFKRYVGGTSNIFTNGNSVPQISGSMTWSPSMNGNIFSHTQTNALTFRGAVSSSLGGGINHNIFMGGTINLGTSAANNFEKAVAGVGVASNAIFGGTINMVAKDTTLTNAPVVSANLLFGSTLTLNLQSSSVTYNSNIQNGTVTLNNSFLPISGTVTAALSPRVTLNTVYGHQHVINMSGSNTATNQSKTYYANILAGMFLSSSMTSNSDANHILATGLLGNSLIVTGSSTAASMVAALTPDSTQGTVIVGRFNDGTGTKASTAETVFAVGTGNTTTRKTGFLIDSGSNTIVDGSLTITGSVYQNVISQSIVSSTASIDLSRANFYRVTLPASTNTRFNITNLAAGQSAMIQITTDTNASASFSTNVKQPSGFAYLPSTGSGNIDVLTLASFDGTNVLVTNVTKLV